MDATVTAMTAPTDVELPRAPRGIAGGVAPGGQSVGHHFHWRGAVPGGEITISPDSLVEAGMNPAAERLRHGLRGDAPAGGRVRHFAVGREPACRTGRVGPSDADRPAGSAIHMAPGQSIRIEDCHERPSRQEEEPEFP